MPSRLAWSSPRRGLWEGRRSGVLVARITRVEVPREGWAAWRVHPDGSESPEGVWATVEGAKRGLESRLG